MRLWLGALVVFGAIAAASEAAAEPVGGVHECMDAPSPPVPDPVGSLGPSTASDEVQHPQGSGPLACLDLGDLRDPAIGILSECRETLGDLS